MNKEIKQWLPRPELQTYNYFKLFDYQMEAINRLRQNNHYALFFRMGRGKTLPTLVFLKEYIDQNKEAKILIIAPLSVAKNTWHTEIEKWNLNMSYSHVLGSTKVKGIQKKANVYITNRESVKWLYDNGHKEWDVVVVDELSSFKDSKSQRYKALKDFKYKRIIGLTGSPASNSLIDLWSQMDLIKRESLFKYKTNFLKKYFVCTLQINNIPVKWEPLKTSKEEIFCKIAPYSMYKESVDIPVTFNNIDIYLEKNEYKQYQELEKYYCLDEIEALSAVALNSKLRQLASGNVITENGIKHIHNQKIKQLKEFIEYQDGNNILIWYDFIASKESIIDLLEKEKISYTLDDVVGWNNNKYNVFLSHPKSMGMGVNMQQGGHVILWYDLTYSLEGYEQANARIARTGQQTNVEVFHFIVKNTVDEAVLKSLIDKDFNQREFLDKYRKEKGYV